MNANYKKIIFVIVTIIILYIIYKIIKNFALNSLLGSISVAGEQITTTTGLQVSLSDEYIANLASDTKNYIEGITIASAFPLLIRSIRLSDYDLARLCIQYRKITSRNLADDWEDEYIFSYSNAKLRDELVARIRALNLP